MTSSFDIATMTLSGVEFVFGFVINIFIMAVLIPDWVKNRTVNACNLILVTLGLSNLCFLCVAYADILLFKVAARTYHSGIVYHMFNLCWYLTINFNSWLTACLCVFYCLKIVEINQPFFIHLKLRISEMVLRMIIASIFVSLILSLPTYWNSFLRCPQNSTDDPTGCIELYRSVPYTVAMSVFGSGLPLLLGVISLMLTLWSLCKHTRRMKRNAANFSQPQLEAHFSAVRTMICLLSMYVCFSIADMYLILNTTENRRLFAVFMITVMSYAPAQSIILVLGNSKLKQTFLRMIYCSRGN